MSIDPVKIQRPRPRHKLPNVLGKEFKDRVVPVSVKTIEMVDAYMDHYKPQKYLFEGQWPGGAV